MLAKEYDLLWEQQSHYQVLITELKIVWCILTNVVEKKNLPTDIGAFSAFYRANTLLPMPRKKQLLHCS